MCSETSFRYIVTIAITGMPHTGLNVHVSKGLHYYYFPTGCSRKACPPIKCIQGSISHTPEGECCPSCTKGKCVYHL